MTYDRKDIPAIADDYVLGLLEASEAAAIETATERDGELRAAIAASRERFLPLDTSVAPAAVNSALWSNIESRLPPQAKFTANKSTRTANDNRKTDGGRSPFPPLPQPSFLPRG